MRRPGIRRRPGVLLAGSAIVLAVLAVGAVIATVPAAAADNPYQRGPNPTEASVAADTGPFATATVAAATGNGFGSGTIYYPSDTSQGTFGGIAIAPGYQSTWAYISWLGPRLASQGFVVIGIDTLTPNDDATSRGTQLLAALDYLARTSPVHSRVDPNRLAVAGHSMGGGGALDAALRRSTLKAAVGFAPFLPSGNLSTDRVPTFIFGGQNDTLVTASYLNGMYGTLPAATESAYLTVAGVDHGTIVGGAPDPVVARTMIPWLKIFVDNDTRYTQFLCPLADSSGVVQYRGTCPLTPVGVPTPTATSASPSTVPTSASPSTVPTSATPTSTVACRVTYSANSWSTGFTANVVVTNTGSTPINGWTVRWTWPGDQRVSNSWNAAVTQSGADVTAVNAAWNASIASGASTSFGFQASYSGSNSAPTRFSLNGSPCGN